MTKTRALASAVLTTAALWAPLQGGAQTPGATTYRILPSSRFEVRTTSEGVFGFAGHDHLIRAGAFGGSATYDAGEPSNSSVELVVHADSLEVLSPADENDRRKIRKRMLDEVLRAAENPEIHFRSSAVEPMTGDSLRLQGELTIAGTARPVTLEVGTHLSGDTLRVFGGFDASLTDYGIEPPTVVLGTVKVGDRIHFVVDAVLVAAEHAGAPAHGPTSPQALPPGPKQTPGR